MTFPPYEQADRNDCDYEILYVLTVYDGPPESGGQIVPLPSWMVFDPETRTLSSNPDEKSGPNDVSKYYFDVGASI